ncbi:receptor-like protein kinase HERK 1, partial [Tanacetum coccineum]
IKRGNGKFVQKESKYENVEQRKYEFEIEIRVLSRFKHHNIVSLIGYCHEEDEMILVYGYTLNKSLDTYLESTKGAISSLTWAQRLKICIGVANGLEFLYLGYVDQVKTVRGIHGDIKSANILLDQNFQAVIGDFGLSTFAPRNEQLISSFKYRRAGTPGFVDPYYVKTGRLSEKVDIYSFGVLLLEVLSGKPASSQFCDKLSTQVQAMDYHF